MWSTRAICGSVSRASRNLVKSTASLQWNFEIWQWKWVSPQEVSNISIYLHNLVYFY